MAKLVLTLEFCGDVMFLLNCWRSQCNGHKVCKNTYDTMPSNIKWIKLFSRNIWQSETTKFYVSVTSHHWNKWMKCTNSATELVAAESSDCLYERPTYHSIVWCQMMNDLQDDWLFVSCDPCSHASNQTCKVNNWW